MKPFLGFDVEAYCAEVDVKGFALVSEVVSNGDIETIFAELGHLQAGQSSRRGKVYAARNLLSTAPSIANLARSSEVHGLVAPILGSTSFPVRGILFDKVPGANWHVGWHQDQVIPVAERKEVAGFAAWSVKQGVRHVRPPAPILERMLTLRVHLDDCIRDNGALKVIPGSHKLRLLSNEQIQDIVARVGPIMCEARRGTVLVMRPLLLHASAPSMAPSHRRVIHLEFAADPLPGGLQWPR